MREGGKAEYRIICRFRGKKLREFLSDGFQVFVK